MIKMNNNEDQPECPVQCPSMWWTALPIGILLIIIAVMAVIMWRWWRELSAQHAEFNSGLMQARDMGY